MLVMPVRRPVLLADCLEPPDEPFADLFRGCHGDLLNLAFDAANHSLTADFPFVVWM
jgi:hypothetical protein